MAGKKRGLGRGLDALLGGGGVTKEHIIKQKSESEFHNVPVEFIQPGAYQPRIDMHSEALEELANSIKAQGIVQPIVIRAVADSTNNGDQKYEIIAGERRWKAAQIAGLSKIPAIIRDVSDKAAIAMALVENIQREELNPIEESTALKRLIDEFNMTHQMAANAVGRSRAAVSNLLRLLELETGTRQLLENGDLEMGHARALLGIKGVEQNHTAQHIVNQGLSVRETERLVKKILNPKAMMEKKQDPNITHLQSNLSDKLGAKVLFQHNTKGQGKMVIHYNNIDELEGIIKHIR